MKTNNEKSSTQTWSWVSLQKQRAQKVAHLIGWPRLKSNDCCQSSALTVLCINPLLWTVPPDIIKKSYWHRSSSRDETINPVAMRQPHQTDNLLSWCILQCFCPGLASDHRPHSPRHPSSAGRRPSSPAAWMRPGEGRGFSWHAESWHSKEKKNISAQWCRLTSHTLMKSRE